MCHANRQNLALTLMVSLLTALTSVPFARAAEKTKPTPAEIVKRGKAATAMVDRDQYGSATAFCIDKDGYFITNHHVVKTMKVAVDIKLVLNAGEKDQRVLIAEVVRSDPKTDLALLRVKDAKNLTALELGSDDDLIETTPVTAFGFPLGSWLALEARTYPNITVSTGKITALRKEKGELGAIQIDAQANPGNSGGPVVDESGKVLGVVVSGVVGTGLNFAIPVSHLRRFLTQPSVSVTAPVVLYKNRRQPAKFEVEVFMSKKPSAPLIVELTLPGESEDKPRVQEVKMVGERVTLTMAPLPSVAGPEKLRVQTSVDGKTALVGDMIDHEFKVGDKIVRLIDVETLSRDNMDPDLFKATLTTRETLSGKITGLRELVDAKGDKHVLKNPWYLNVFAVDVEPREVVYQVKIRSGKEVLHTMAGKIVIQQPPTKARADMVPSVPVNRDVQPGSLKIIEAKYGWGGRVMVDVTKAVSAAVKNDRVLLPIELSALGLKEDPAFGKAKKISVRYRYNSTEQVAYGIDGGMLVITAPVKVTKEQAFTIIEARYGTGTQWLDVTDHVKKLVTDPKDPRLKFKVDPNVISGGKDPAAGQKKIFVVVYTWLGQQHARWEYDGANISIDAKRDDPDN